MTKPFGVSERTQKPAPPGHYLPHVTSPSGTSERAARAYVLVLERCLLWQCRNLEQSRQLA